MTSIVDLQRMNDSLHLAGEVTDIATLTRANSMLVTAVRSGSDALKLITWRVNSAGPVTRLGDSGSQAGEASSIAIAEGSLIVTACRTGSDNLRLISWRIDPSGSEVVRQGDSGDAAGEASLISIVALSQTLFVTACRTGSGNLLLISWRLNGNGSFSRLRDSGSAAGAVQEIALVQLSSTSVVTAVRDGSGELTLISWSVSSSGSFTRQADSGNAAGEATLIRAVVDQHGHVITAVREGSGDLRMISWSFSGGAVSRLADSGSQAGDIRNNSLVVLPDGVVSAVRAGDGTLKLIAWEVSSTGRFTRRGDSGSQAGTATNIEVVRGPGIVDAAGHSVSLVTALRTASRDLKIITWGPAVVRVHAKVLIEPTGFSRAQMLQAMRDVYASVGIGVVLASEEVLDLPLLELVDVGECAGDITTEQDQLFANRNDIGDNDIAVYFVRATNPPLNGCASSPSGRPSAIVVATASRFTLGHEVGHVLGLRHVNDSNRLMTGGGTDGITNPPPDLIASEQSTMIESRLTVLA
jgi:hypothetical protein